MSTKQRTIEDLGEAWVSETREQNDLVDSRVLEVEHDTQNGQVKEAACIQSQARS